MVASATSTTIDCKLRWLRDGMVAIADLCSSASPHERIDVKLPSKSRKLLQKITIWADKSPFLLPGKRCSATVFFPPHFQKGKKGKNTTIIPIRMWLFELGIKRHSRASKLFDQVFQLPIWQYYTRMKKKFCSSHIKQISAEVFSSMVTFILIF